jgi:signal transduction histidine kinase
MKIRGVDISHNLGSRLLKVVFGFYFILTAGITMIQMWSEYDHVKHQMFQELVKLKDTFTTSLAKSLWEFNIEQLNVILTGLEKIEVVSGVIVTKDSFIVSKVGDIPIIGEGRGEIGKLTRKKTQTDKIYKVLEESTNFLNQKYEFSYPVTMVFRGEKKFLGDVYFYSSDRIVFNKVKHGFFLILINSLLKTIGFWIIFLLVIRKMVQRPLVKMKDVISGIDLTRPEQLMQQTNNLTHLSVRKDELGSLSAKYCELIDKISNDFQTINDLNENLEEKVVVRTQQLEESHKKYLEMAHRVGMAEISSSLIHDLGNSTAGVSRFKHELGEIKGDMEQYSQITNKIKGLNKKDQTEQFYQGLDDVLTDMNNQMQENYQQLARLEEGIGQHYQYLVLLIESKKEYSKLQTLNTTFRLVDTINNCWENLGKLISLDSIKLELRGEEDLTVSTDPFKLEFILKEIIRNSVEANSHQITIDMEQDEEGSLIRINIIDNGVGITNEVAKKAMVGGFTLKANARGMGLHEAANFLALMNGKITIESLGEDLGTRVSIELPRWEIST